MAEKTQHKDIFEAINAVMQEVGYVQKQRSGGLNYSFAGEAALIAALRPSMVEHGVFCFVSNMEVITRDRFENQRGTVMSSTVIRGNVIFQHTSGTSIMVAALGESMDSGDKGANKAATGLLKYALRQTFLIETGDDPDKDDPSNNQPSRPTQAPAQNAPKPAQNDKPLMAIETAEAVLNSEGRRYGTIPTDKLSHMYDSLIDSLKKNNLSEEDRTEKEYKRDAIKVIQLARGAGRPVQR